MNKFEVIDFHCHPFLLNEERIGAYTDCVDMTMNEFLAYMEFAGATHFCGSVLSPNCKGFDDLKKLNRHALEIREIYNGKYIPGFHVHPHHIEESIKEIDFAIENNVKMIGELVPYSHNWKNYCNDGFMEILDYLNGKGLLLNIHIGAPEELFEIENAVKKFKDLTFVLAHPGYQERFDKHIDMLLNYENVYLDLSGSGIELHGKVQYLIQKVGYERLLFGSDFPVTAVSSYVEIILNEKISDTAKEHILSKNAKKLLNI